ncbi:universal stress protein [Halomonas sp. C05BenzN]|uniref:universal stress protein n=1 Tax=Halomonas sp. C05BenzN TaxID=3411041 RepID=UPI003B95E09D
MNDDTHEQGEALPEAARVLALLDASRQSLAALSAAVDLAASRQAELVALFVEDIDLLASAGFPFSREVGAQSGLSRPLSPEAVEASLARQVKRATQALAEAVAGRQVRHRFQVSRGRVASEALALAGPGDLLVLGKAGLSGQWGVRLGSTSRALILEAPCTVIIWDERLPTHRGPLRLMSPADPELPAASLAALEPLFDGVEALPAMDATTLERYLARARSGALLLHRPELARLAEQDPQLLGRIPVPIIVVP